MKKTQTLRGLLGVSQEDLALLLVVNRTTFAKYEAGSRKLPQAATQLLADMITYMCDTSSKVAGLAEQYTQKLKAVERMIKENDYLQQATARKITYVENKCQEYLKALQLVEFLSLRGWAKETDEAAILRTIAHKATNGLKNQGFEKLFKLQLKLEMLQSEKMLLDYEVIKTSRALENIGVRNNLQI